ncbi:conserved hypothetical protein [Ricinus communis]|uniref:Uncharacterized protein n=1 Tax=Ricinus communis TaxID=3988 RepID=B9T5P9_RICCO|nr:conserved hypothetical protein [Ricinus communis]
MALDTVVLQQDPFGNGYMDIYTIGGGSTGPWIHGFNNFEGEKACNNETLIAAFGIFPSVGRCSGTHNHKPATKEKTKQKFQEPRRSGASEDDTHYC